jgi:glyoxylase-like metal-dependent hydrolase (beta-lactamase superfamily II)
MTSRNVRETDARIAEHLFRCEVPNLLGPSGQPTNVYIVGPGPATLIDAGSDDSGATVLAALQRLGIDGLAQIILTHAHQDHAGSATALRALTGAPVSLHPRDVGASGRHNIDLQVDRLLAADEVIAAGNYRFQVIETPGHAQGHVSLYEPTMRALFAGDLMSGNGTIAVVPPRGSMGEYMASLRRVSRLDVDMIYPGHGPAIPNGNERIAQYISHRERREQDIVETIESGSDTVAAITDVLYADVLPRIRPQAAGTVLAHVIHLIEQGRISVIHEGPTIDESQFAVV